MARISTAQRKKSKQKESEIEARIQEASRALTAHAENACFLRSGHVATVATIFEIPPLLYTVESSQKCDKV
jgi:hypothetical protein